MTAEPIGVPLNQVHLWGGPARTQAFEALKAGQLEGYKLGKKRMVTMASLRRFIAAAVAAERA
jgi:hypothetical protein